MTAGPRSLELKLTLWYSIALAVIIIAHSAFVFFVTRASLYHQLDHNLHDHVEAAEAQLERGPDGKVRWREPRASERVARGRWIEVWSEAGELLAKDAASGLPAPTRAEVGARTLEESAQGCVRVVTGESAIDGFPVFIRVVRIESPVRDELSRLILILALGLVAAVALAGIGGWVLARRALAPVQAIADQARAITAEKLAERLPVRGTGDELDQLAQVFNKTLERLERSFDQLRRFTADASHELRTPLTKLRTTGEVALREGAPSAAADVIASMLEETDQLTRLVDSLLTLSRADAGTVRLHKEGVDLAELVREIAQFLGVLAEEKGQTLSVEASAPVVVTADRLVLRQAVMNLLDNAIKYSGRGATITLRATTRGVQNLIEVTDTGVGIAPEHRARVFDRFYRVDTARSREHGGTGLGLAIAKWAVEANGGRIELESEVGRGSTFRIVFDGA